MKKQDFLFIILVVVVFLPFFLSDAVYDWYKSFNAAHGMVMSFLKFAILSSLGEVLGLRISAGVYNRKGFGIIPRMVVWGILGMGINAAMIIFSKGVPQFMEYMGMANAAATFTSEAMSLDKVLVALAISVTSLITPIPMTKIITGLNWNVQWNFVFKKTIPFFWYPAHTITFMLPPDMRVLFAALLGIVLGVLLAVAARK